MKRNVFAVLAAAATLATAISFSTAFAESHMNDNMEHSAMGGLGFRSSDAPIGIRWWFNHQVALDAGIGFTSEKLNYSDVNGDPANESFRREHKGGDRRASPLARLYSLQSTRDVPATPLARYRSTSIHGGIS